MQKFNQFKVVMAFSAAVLGAPQAQADWFGSSKPEAPLREGFYLLQSALRE